MSDLVAFLRARLDEDEQAANACPGPAWEHRQIKGTYDESVVFEDYVAVHDDERVVVLSDITADGVLPFVLRFDPARVLAEVDAKRRIIEAHQPIEPPDGPDDTIICGTCGPHGADAFMLRGANLFPCITMRLLALPYADHPDYDEAWRP